MIYSSSTSYRNCNPFTLLPFPGTKCLIFSLDFLWLFVCFLLPFPFSFRPISKFRLHFFRVAISAQKRDLQRFAARAFAFTKLCQRAVFCQAHHKHASFSWYHVAVFQKAIRLPLLRPGCLTSFQTSWFPSAASSSERAGRKGTRGTFPGRRTQSPPSVEQRPRGLGKETQSRSQRLPRVLNSASEADSNLFLLPCWAILPSLLFPSPPTSTTSYILTCPCATANLAWICYLISSSRSPVKAQIAFP